LELLGRLPELGETVPIDGYRAEVLAADETRITELRFTPAPHELTRTRQPGTADLRNPAVGCEPRRRCRLASIVASTERRQASGTSGTSRLASPIERLR
jgi:hypothetical protein